MSKMPQCLNRRARTSKKTQRLTRQSTVVKMPHCLRSEIKPWVQPLPARPSPGRRKATRIFLNEVSPCERNSSLKSDGRDLSFLDQLTRSITLIWFGVISVRKNFPSSPKAPTRYSDTTGQSVIFDETSAGATNTCEVPAQLLGRRSTGSVAAMGSF